MSKLVSTSKLSRAMKALWTKSKNLFATKTELAGKAEKTHSHDDRYYTESEINSKLSGKAESGHVHDDRYFNKAPVRLDGSQNLNTITSPGNYVVASGSITNAPKQYGRMVVLGWSDGNKWVTQIFYGDVNNEVYVRCSTNAQATAWTPWAKLFTSTFKPTWAEIDGKPSSFTPAAHNHDANYAAKSHTHNYLPSGATITKEGEDFFINY